MYGSIGTVVNVVFRTVILSVVLVTCAQATIFHSSDVFSKEEKLLPAQQSLKDVSKEQKILIFINPQCPWCQKALEGLSDFKKRSPHWAIQVYMISSMQEFINFFHQHITDLPSDLEYTLDFKNQLADNYEVNRTPTYIIINHGQTQKVEGYVDLVHFVLDDNS